MKLSKPAVRKALLGNLIFSVRFDEVLFEIKKGLIYFPDSIFQVVLIKSHSLQLIELFITEVQEFFQGVRLKLAMCGGKIHFLKSKISFAFEPVKKPFQSVLRVRFSIMLNDGIFDPAVDKAKGHSNKDSKSNAQIEIETAVKIQGECRDEKGGKGEHNLISLLQKINDQFSILNVFHGNVLSCGVLGFPGVSSAGLADLFNSLSLLVTAKINKWAAVNVNKNVSSFVDDAKHLSGFFMHFPSGKLEAA